MVSIFVDYGGKRGGIVIRGLPNYQGTWTGSYAIKSCTCTGDFLTMDACSLFPINSVGPTDFNLTQNDDAVQGSFHLGTLMAATNGPIQNNGQLLLSGKIYEAPITIDVSWRLQSKDPGKITGTFNQIWRMTGYSGDVRIHSKIRNLNRTSSMATMLIPVKSLIPNPTLKDVLRAMSKR